MLLPWVWLFPHSINSSVQFHSELHNQSRFAYTKKKKGNQPCKYHMLKKYTSGTYNTISQTVSLCCRNWRLTLIQVQLKKTTNPLFPFLPPDWLERKCCIIRTLHPMSAEDKLVSVSNDEDFRCYRWKTFWGLQHNGKILEWPFKVYKYCCKLVFGELLSHNHVLYELDWWHNSVQKHNDFMRPRCLAAVLSSIN